MRYLVVSQPKSGTMLSANLLQEFGLTFSYVHIFGNRYVKRHPEIWNSNDFHERLAVPSDVATGLKQVPEDTFALSHLSPIHHNSIELTKNFRKILITRDYNEIRESAKRFEDKFDIKIGNLSDQRLDNIALWAEQPDVFHLTFNDMIEKNTKVLDALQVWIRDDIKFDSETAINNALANDTPTKSYLRD